MESEKKRNTLGYLKRHKLIAIIRNVDAQDIVTTAQALVAGGITMMEITFDQSCRGGIDNTVKCLQFLKKEMGEQILLGAGTVMQTEQVELAFQYGASYIISPDTNVEIIEMTRKFGMVSIPGALTPTEIAHAYHLGADIIKIFPGGLLGAEYIKTVRGPFPHIPLVAVGGIGPDQIRAFAEAGACAFGIGSNLVSRKLVKEKRFDTITKTAALLCAQIL